MAGGLFAFLLTTDRGFSHRVHVCDGFGRNLRRVTERRATGRPTFAPDGRRLVFPGPLTDDSEGRFCLYVVGVDGSGLRRLTTPRVADTDPAWSPDGQRIAFVRDPLGAMDPARYTLHLMTVDAGDGTQLVATQGAREPAWSPDSRRIAFVAFGRLYTVNADGSGLQVLADGGVRQPSWSPDGTKIAFAQRVSASRSRVVSMPITGGPLTVLADLGAQVEDPTWAADSSTVSFLGFRGQGWDGRGDEAIWRVASGGAQRVLPLPFPGVRLTFFPDPPPGSPTGLAATEVTQRTIRLRWTNPPDVDLVATDVRMVTGTQPPDDPAEGLLVYSGRTPEAFVVEGIDPASTYSFAVFARDKGDNVSAAATTTVVTPPPGVPDPPAYAEAVPGKRSARISWTAPLNDGGQPIVGYTVVQDRTSQSREVGPDARSVVVTELEPGQSHVFAVLARNVLGPSAPAAANAVVPDDGIVEGTYVALTPRRLVDTRLGRAPVTPTADLAVQVAGAAGVPPGATAVAAALVATEPAGAGFLAAYPAGAQRPVVSTLNYVARQTVANLDVVRLGGGAIMLGVGGAAAHVIADVAGCYVGADGPAGGRLNALSPARLLDTRRAGSSSIGAGGSITLKVTGTGGVPPSGVGSVVLVLVAVAPSASTYLTVHPADATRPTASVLNAARGETVAVLVFARVSADGRVAIYNNAGSTDVVVDVLGYHTTTAADPGEAYVPLAPARVLDTRSGVGTRSGPVPGEGVVVLPLHGVGGVPPTARTVLLNVTATQASQATHITVFPADRRAPDTSVLNVARGRTIANLVLAKLSPDGRVALRNAAGEVHLVADVRGYYSI